MCAISHSETFVLKLAVFALSSKRRRLLVGARCENLRPEDQEKWAVDRHAARAAASIVDAVDEIRAHTAIIRRIKRSALSNRSTGNTR
jgi:hypothetical protein